MSNYGPDRAAADQGGAAADQGGATLDQGGATALQDGATEKLNQEERRAQICLYLRTRIVKKSGGEGFRTERGAFDAAAQKFGCKTCSVRRVWRRYKNAICHPDKYELNVARKKGSGCHRKHELEEVYAMVKKVPLRYRHSIRTLAQKVGIPRSTLQRVLREVGLTDGDAVKQEAAAAKGGETSEGQRTTISQKTQNEMRLIQLEQAKTTEVEEARREAKLEARREYDLQLKEMRMEFLSEREEMRDELQREFKSKKDRVLYQLRAEMERHSMVLARLKGELDEIGFDFSSSGGSVDAEKRNEGGHALM